MYNFDFIATAIIDSIHLVSYGVVPAIILDLVFKKLFVEKQRGEL